MVAKPQPPDRDNPFDKLSKTLSDFIKSSDTRQRASDARTEKLFKEMLVYFKLLEKAVNKGTLFSKKGKETELNEDKGFLKLIELMTDIDDSFRDVINKYVAGNKLVASEKADLAKFIQRLQDSLVSSNEKIGISLEDMISSFKTMLSDNKLSEEFRLDILKFLKDYSEEDVALTTELKDLIKQSIAKNEISDENLVKILTELDSTFDGYLKKEKNATFAPFQKISKQLIGANLALDDIVDILTKTQREKEGDKDKKGGFKESMKQSITGNIAAMGGDAVNLLVRYAAIKMSKNPLTKKISPLVAGASGIAGGIGATYLSTRGLPNIVKDAKALGGFGLKTGKAVVTKGIGYGIAAGTGLYGLGHGFQEGKKKGGLAQGFREAGAEDLSNIANTLTLGIADKLGINKKSMLQGGKFYEDRLTKLMEPMADVAGYMMSAKPKQDIEGLQTFIGEQNKKIFGNQLNLGQILTTFITNPLRNVQEGAKNIQEQVQNKVENIKANEYTQGVKGFKKGITGTEDVRLRDIPSYMVKKGGNALTKGLQSFGSYIPGMGSWSDRRGSTKQGDLISLDTLGLNRQKFQNDKPLVQKDFGVALKKAQEEIKKTYGNKAGFNISGALSGIDPKTGKLSHASKQHKVGTAVDIGSSSGLSTQDTVKILAKYGITRPNAKGDPVHFEFTGVPSKDKTEIASKPQQVAKMPKVKTTKSQETPQSSQNVIVASQPPQQQAERKIKSDNDLINFTNAYGVL